METPTTASTQTTTRTIFKAELPFDVCGGGLEYPGTGAAAAGLGGGLLLRCPQFGQNAELVARGDPQFPQKIAIVAHNPGCTTVIRDTKLEVT
jgi:hypothetical protein